MQKNIYDIIIIGSGPAGLTAAIYSARARLKTLVLGGIKYGGQLMDTTLVENYPGFKDGIMGPELMQNMIDQSKNQGSEILFELVDKVDFSGEEKKVWASDVEYCAKAIIIAVGSSPKTLDIPGEKEYWGRGVSSCATCDGAFYKEKVIAVVGGGDSAMEEASYLTRFASKVYLIHRRDEFRASKAMQERVFNNPKIEIIWNSEVKQIMGNDSVNEIEIYNNVEKVSSELEVNGFFLAIGHVPNSSFLGNAVELDEKGFIKVSHHTYTSVDGVFVAGDVHDHHYQQAVTAAGMGCMAAMDAEKWLASQS